MGTTDPPPLATTATPNSSSTSRAKRNNPSCLCSEGWNDSCQSISKKRLWALFANTAPYMLMHRCCNLRDFCIARCWVAFEPGSQAIRWDGHGGFLLNLDTSSRPTGAQVFPAQVISPCPCIFICDEAQGQEGLKAPSHWRSLTAVLHPNRWWRLNLALPKVKLLINIWSQKLDIR